MRWLLPVLLLLSGCATDSLTLPKAPAWVQPADLTEFDSLRVFAEVRAVAPQAFITYTDSYYTLVSHRWLNAYIVWTERVAPELGIRYTRESFDCDNFTGLFNEVARKKAADAGVVTAPLLAKVTLRDGAAMHMLVGVATDKGLFIVEPQPNSGLRIHPLSAEKRTIVKVEL